MEELNVHRDQIYFYFLFFYTNTEFHIILVYIIILRVWNTNKVFIVFICNNPPPAYRHNTKGTELKNCPRKNSKYVPASESIILPFDKKFSEVRVGHRRRIVRTYFQKRQSIFNG